jgi:hypothetical protein
MASVELNETDPDRGPCSDEQPIQRVIGKRTAAPPGTLPSPAARSAMTANARYLTRFPKGIYLYDSPEQMNRDRERWTVELMLARQEEHRRPQGTPEGDGGSP